MLNFKASNPNGYKAEIRRTDTLDYRASDPGFSVFTWKDTESGIYCWREHHQLEWEDAYTRAQSWLSL